MTKRMPGHVSDAGDSQSALQQPARLGVIRNSQSQRADVTTMKLQDSVERPGLMVTEFNGQGPTLGVENG
jgi:hypothetical protein